MLFGHLNILGIAVTLNDPPVEIVRIMGTNTLKLKKGWDMLGCKYLIHLRSVECEHAKTAEQLRSYHLIYPANMFGFFEDLVSKTYNHPYLIFG